MVNMRVGNQYLSRGDGMCLKIGQKRRLFRLGIHPGINNIRPARYLGDEIGTLLIRITYETLDIHPPKTNTADSACKSKHFFVIMQKKKCFAAILIV